MVLNRDAYHLEGTQSTHSPKSVGGPCTVTAPHLTPPRTVLSAAKRSPLAYQSTRLSHRTRAGFRLVSCVPDPSGRREKTSVDSE